MSLLQTIGVEYVVKGQTQTALGGVVLATGGFGADFSNTSLLKEVEAEWR
jgi:aspartate oxidase